MHLPRNDRPSGKDADMVMLGLLFVALVLILLAAGAVWNRVSARKLREDGVETTAEVSRIETEKTTDYDGTVFVTHTYFVTYQDSKGETVEAEIPDPNQKLEVGTQVKIRYLPNRQDHPTLVEIL